MYFCLLRACKCWDLYRQGGCSDKLSNYIGENVNITKAKKHSSYRYFMRTYKDGGNMGDTSDFNHYKGDFVYHDDKTCEMDNPDIRNFQVSHVPK